MTLNDTGTAASRGSSWKKWLGIITTATVVVGFCVLIRHIGGGPEKAAATPPQKSQSQQATVSTVSNTRQDSPASAATAGATTAQVKTSPQAKTSSIKDNSKAPPPEIVADVNGRRITREDLAQQCLVHCGKEILEQMIHKQLIVGECRRRNITITRKEIDAEIEHMAARFGIPVDQWFKLLKQERDITPDQYADDIIWPMLALRRLAGDKLQVSKDELVKEFEIQYGPAVKARLISCKEEGKAKKLREMAMAKPEDFGNLAKDYSEDTASAAAKGLIQPIRMHGSYEGIEQAAFNMSDGEISQVIPAGGQYVIIKRESLIPARDCKLDEVAGQLEEVVRESKMRKVANGVFQELKDNAKLEIVWGDPAKQQKTPGVAALINGEPITIRDLALECIDRHGTELLEVLINRVLLEVECKKRDVAVSDKDMSEEIARAASLAVKPKPDGSPDVDAWIEQITKAEGVTLEMYRNDAVWPSAALRKLAGEKVDISEDDLQKGFEANYGVKVRCLAIVLDNQRRAQEVFEKARKRNTSEFFGELAAQYSIEPGSNALRGEVPPIRKWGGQPILEKEAFALKPGELSGIIQASDKFILLRCEGFTKPADVKFADVRDEIYKDLYEKKLYLKMAECFEKLQDSATIHNYLAGTSHTPKEISKAPEGINLPTIKQVQAKKG
ncbi:MAG: peptidylprolyl isomerase [Thermoguttaceae bacterium]|jgi:parvulin-like peptidyl-prolyl isomerase